MTYTCCTLTLYYGAPNLSSLFRDFFRWIYPNQPPSTSTLAKKKRRGMTCVLTEAAEAKIKESTSSLKRSGGDSSLGEKRK